MHFTKHGGAAPQDAAVYFGSSAEPTFRSPSRALFETFPCAHPQQFLECGDASTAVGLYPTASLARDFASKTLIHRCTLMGRCLTNRCTLMGRFIILWADTFVRRRSQVSHDTFVTTSFIKYLLLLKIGRRRRLFEVQKSLGLWCSVCE